MISQPNMYHLTHDFFWLEALPLPKLGKLRNTEPNIKIGRSKSKKT